MKGHGDDMDVRVGSRVIVTTDIRGNLTIFTGATGKVSRQHKGKDRFNGYFEVQFDEPISTNTGRIVAHELFHECELINEALKPGKRVTWKEYYGRPGMLTGVIYPRHSWAGRSVAVFVDAPGPSEGRIDFIDAKNLKLI